LRERGSPADVDEILKQAVSGERITEGQALALLTGAPLHALGETAHRLRLRKADPKIVTYVIDRNINYTNICIARCAFCAFSRDADDPDAYVNSYQPVIRDKIMQAAKLGATQILMQGGLHPTLQFEWYLNLLRAIKRDFPQVTLHSFSPPEVVHFSKLFKMSISDVLSALRESGLDSLPGGGAEILSDRVRRELSPRKCTADEWIEVMRQAHRLGMRTTATMMFGSIETPAERVEHLQRLRTLQDETGGFTAFICWAYQPANTPLGGHASGGVDYLRTLATARIYLDNIANFQASWVTMGAKVGQLALVFGANDLGGTMLEENVVAAAGAHYEMSVAEMEYLIRDAGFTPRQRTTQYELLG